MCKRQSKGDFRVSRFVSEEVREYACGRCVNEPRSNPAIYLLAWLGRQSNLIVRLPLNTAASTWVYNMSITSSWSGSRASSFPRSRGAPDRRTWRKTQDTAPRVPSPLRGELLIELQREDISKSPCDSKIRDCSYIASYSWLDGTAPAVLIPGTSFVLLYSLLPS